MHHLYAALRANHLYHRDQHYVVQDGEWSSSTNSPAA
jgi:preprotein translocase subunit SecA